jgi:hypothetical protein
MSDAGVSSLAEAISQLTDLHFLHLEILRLFFQILATNYLVPQPSKNKV